MSTLQNNDKKFYRGVNPIIRKLSKVTEVADEKSRVDFSGITSKTILLLVATVVGFGGYYGFSKYLAFGGELHLGNYLVYVPQLVLAIVAFALIVVAPFVVWHIQKAIKAVGAVCSIAQGVLFAWGTKTFAGEYNEIAVLSFITILALIYSMLMMYKHKIVRPEQKVKFVVLEVILTTAISTVILFIAYFVPGARPFVDSISNNTALTYGISIVSVVVCVLLLMCDFNYIEKRIKKGLNQDYQWLISFGLSFTVIWIYFKVFDLFVKTK